MTPSQRLTAFERLLADTARARAKKLGFTYLGTIRKLPPPPLPGEPAGATRYFLNAVSPQGAGLVELQGAEGRALAAAELWASTGKGRRPAGIGTRTKR